MAGRTDQVQGLSWQVAIARKIQKLRFRKSPQGPKFCDLSPLPPIGNSDRKEFKELGNRIWN